MAFIAPMSEKAKKLRDSGKIDKEWIDYLGDPNSVITYIVKLAGKEYDDTVYINKHVANAYIQCSWFSPEEMEFMEAGLEALGQNATISLKYSHHPLSHQYNDINVNDHPEVMNDPVWQQATYQMDITAMDRSDLGVALFMPSKNDIGIGYEMGYLKASHKPNIVVLPDEEKDIPLNLMPGIGNTQIITLSEVKDFDFTDVIYKPYKGKVF